MFSLILIILSFLLLFVFYKEIKFTYLTTVFILTLLHHSISIFNAFYVPLSLLSKDSLSFYKDAATSVDPLSFGWNFNAWMMSLTHFDFLNREPTPYTIYYDLLKLLYKIDTSLIVGQSLSIIAYVFCCILLYKFLKKAGYEQYAIPILLLFSLNPIDLVFTSGNLREVYELLFYMLSCYFLFNYIFNGAGQIKHFIFFMLSASFAALFHQGLVLCSLMLSIVFIIIASFRNQTYKNTMRAVVCICIFMLSTLAIYKSQYLLLHVYRYHMHMPLARTRYTSVPFYPLHSPYMRATILTTESIAFNLYSIWALVINFINYLFYPFPWLVKDAVSLYASVMAVLRLILIMSCVYSCRIKNYIFLLFAMIPALVFSLGTGNYGTSLRHNILTWWALLIAGLPPLIKGMKQLLIRSKDQNVTCRTSLRPS